MLSFRASCALPLIQEDSLLTLRKANVDDARELAQIAERTFRATFADMNTAANMDLHCQESYSESIQAAEIVDPNTITLLSENEGTLIGFAQLRWSEAPECVVAESQGEIHRLYVVEGWHGKGIAQDLMNASLEEMETRHSDTVWLGVWEHNARAISFYKKFGFAEVGDHVYPVGIDLQRDLVMARPIG